ncbi:hypothetical protein NECAME_16006 [Necator americanus]|uniref:Uncharacterized protein n=1 Tax=Necator americanus TaxID=51031 RepID=W2TY39_NECAM|nr:hypothetical protein NECAME_16006 [Necator americanus]ETN86985.1 hypothetical protein NECAME_16006 [Necator americanus]
MMLAQIAVLTIAVCVAGANSVRVKRQLSPAVRLESELHPLMMGMYGFGSEASKRSPLSLKRHISPSFDVEEDVGNLRTLMDIGKRQVSLADDVGRQMQASVTVRPYSFKHKHICLFIPTRKVTNYKFESPHIIIFRIFD